jgi:hypothetical protein
MSRWLITWVCLDRYNQRHFVMDVWVGEFWEDAVVSKLKIHGPDTNYPEWAVLNIQVLSVTGHSGADELVRLLKD